ncbi:hypothetical protein IWQ47_000387 [Aquimarina sp. EL_43]|nr:hypothetical protein [Aquimarina sp. EL_35]MBG6149984.1 hypothetical protein [Aquimarina sp. EL_32]MBG6167329.1 hypothetical protein [Aquimarina sp. EL_43]
MYLIYSILNCSRYIYNVYKLIYPTPFVYLIWMNVYKIKLESKDYLTTSNIIKNTETTR